MNVILYHCILSSFFKEQPRIPRRSTPKSPQPWPLLPKNNVSSKSSYSLNKAIKFINLAFKANFLQSIREKQKSHKLQEVIPETDNVSETVPKGHRLACARSYGFAMHPNTNCWFESMYSDKKDF